MKTYSDELICDLIDGENKVEISILNKVVAGPLRETVCLKHEAKQKGDLYVSGLGVSAYKMGISTYNMRLRTQRM